MVSYIFTYRQTTVDRANNLKIVLNWLELLNIQNLEVIIVEQDDVTKFQIDRIRNFPIKHIFVKNTGLFNRSWGFNVAVKNTINPILFFGDSDMIIAPAVMIEAINILKTSQFEVVSPFAQCLELSKEETETINLQTFNYTLEKVPRGGMNFCSGIVAYNRSALERIYGWDERFEGWGGEDDIQFLKTRQLLKFVTLNAKCYHLYHERSKNDGTNRHDNYGNNLKLFWHYHHNPTAILIDMKNYTNYGDINRYAR